MDRKPIKIIKLIFILVKHGINPFRKVGKIEKKLQNRLTDKEKEWIVSICPYMYGKQFWIKTLKIKDGEKNE